MACSSFFGRRRALVATFVAAAACAAMIYPASAEAARPRRAGIVVEHRDGSQEVRCVRFEGKINGYQLIRASGIPFKTAKYPFGKAVCWMDGEGCKTTDPERCFDCDGDEVPEEAFWGYWTQEKGESTPTEYFAGAKDRQVTNGDVDYWQYDASTYPEPQPPPEARTFEEICSK